MKSWIPLWVIPTLIIFATGTVWLRLTIVRITYKVHQTDRLMEQARQEREKLQLRLAALRSPKRLESLARTRFGMSQPRVDQFIYMKKPELLGYDP